MLDHTSPMQLGKQALVVMAAPDFDGHAFSAPKWLFVLPLLPIIGLISVASLWGRCVHCGFTSTPLSVYAPLAELVYLAAGMTLFTFGSCPPTLVLRSICCRFRPHSHRSILYAYRRAEALPGVPRRDIYFSRLLRVQPGSVADFPSAGLHRSHLDASRPHRWASRHCWCGHSLVFGGYVHAGEPPETTASNLVGTSLAQFAPYFGQANAGNAVCCHAAAMRLVRAGKTAVAVHAPCLARAANLHNLNNGGLF